MTDKKPHLLIFNPDQWRGDVLGHMGDPAVHTPVLDRFTAEDAVSFRNAFCQNPVCTPLALQLHERLVPARARAPHHVPHAAPGARRAGAVEDAQGERLFRVVGRQERPDPRSGWVRRILRCEVRARRSGRLDVATEDEEQWRGDPAGDARITPFTWANCPTPRRDHYHDGTGRT